MTESLLPPAFEGCHFLTTLARQTGKRTACFFDIDKTLVMPSGEPSSLFLLAHLGRQNIPLVMVTGNDFAALRPRLESGKIPPGHIIVGSVGTEIFVRRSDLPDEHCGGFKIWTPNGYYYYVPEFVWMMELQKRGFDRLALANHALDFIQLMNEAFTDCAFDFQHPARETQFASNGQLTPELESQRHKLSFYFMADSPAKVARIVQMAQQTFKPHRVVCCGEIGYNDTHVGELWQKYCLDILVATKADVCHYLTQHLGVDTAITGGDSGNDAGMLMNFGQLAIVVGGARWELREAIDILLEGQGVLERYDNFRTVELRNGRRKTIYIESDDRRLGPASLLYAMENWKG